MTSTRPTAFCTISALSMLAACSGRPAATEARTAPQTSTTATAASQTPAVSNAGPSDGQIPVDVVGTVSYRRSQGHAGSQLSKNETVSYTFTAPAVMAVQANDGAGDWWTATLGATHPGASHFILYSDPAREGSVDWTGTGETQPSGSDSRKWKGSFHAKANIVLELSTTGHGDELFCNGALTPMSMNEDATFDEDTTFTDIGTEVSKDSTRTESKHFKGNSLGSSFGSDHDQEVQPWFMESLHPRARGLPGSGAAMSLSYRKLTEIIASGKPGTLTGDEDFSFQSPDGEVVTGHGHMELRLRPPVH